MGVGHPVRFLARSTSGLPYSVLHLRWRWFPFWVTLRMKVVEVGYPVVLGVLTHGLTLDWMDM